MDNPIVIYKYKIKIGKDNILPCGDVLLVDSQNNDLYIWIQHYKDTSWFSSYTIYGTGITDLAENEILEGWKSILDKQHVGSAKCGEYVWHVYSKLIK